MVHILETVGWWIGWAVFGIWFAVLVWWTCGGGRRRMDSLPQLPTAQDYSDR